MQIATRANSRTAHAAIDGFNRALQVAFPGGAVMGMSVAGIGLAGLSLAFYIFGTAVCRVDYHRDFYYEKRPSENVLDFDVDEEGNIVEAWSKSLPDKVPIMRYDGPRASLVSLFDFFPDPQFTTIKDMRYVSEREETTIDKLRAESKRYKDITGKPLYKNLDDIKAYNDNRVADFAVFNKYPLDGAAFGPHTALFTRAFQGRPRGRRSRDEPLAASDYYLTVGSYVDKQ